jgi:surfeit locus 1 family protein
MSRHRTAIAFTAAVAALIAAVQLGNWQSRRAESKLAHERAFKSALAEAAIDVRDGAELQPLGERLPRRVRLHGEFLHRHTVWLDNRVLEGRPGFYVVTPLRLHDGAIVLVNRGWVARDLADPTRLPSIGTPAGTLDIEGLAVSGVPRLLEIGRADPAGAAAIRPNLDLDEVRARLGRPVAPFVVQQVSPLDDGLTRKWEPPPSGVAKHRGYAFQWYALAVLIALLTVGLSWRHLRAKGRRP